PAVQVAQDTAPVLPSPASDRVVDQAQQGPQAARAREHVQGTPAAPQPVAPQPVATATGFQPGAVGGYPGAAASRADAIPYSIQRRGDSVRITVRPPVSGLLTVLERGTDGNWNSIQTMHVNVNGEYTVP